MKKALLLIISALIFVSCNKDDLNCHPETVETSWTIDQKIKVVYNEEIDLHLFSIVEGTNRVFELTHVGYQCDNIYDDEWGERLAFEIPVDLEDFEFIDEEILNTNCFYNQFGAWVRSTQYPIQKGRIKGEKINNNKWKVHVSVTTIPIFDNEEPRSIEFEEVFKE